LKTNKQTNKINKEENNQPISPTLIASFSGGEIKDRVSLMNIILGHLKTNKQKANKQRGKQPTNLPHTSCKLFWGGDQGYSQFTEYNP